MPRYLVKFGGSVRVFLDEIDARGSQLLCHEVALLCQNQASCQKPMRNSPFSNTMRVSSLEQFLPPQLNHQMVAAPADILSTAS